MAGGQNKVDTLKYIIDKYGLVPHKPYPNEIPNIGRVDLARLFNELNFKIGAEIGVWEGRYSEYICKTIPEVELYCIDSWVNYDDYFISNMERAEERARERLQNYNCHFLHMTSMEALKEVPDLSLDFVYIDGNHEFPYVAMDVAFWSKKVRVGGIVSGHDFAKGRRPHSNMHVPSVLWGYTDAYRIRPWFVLGTEAKTHQPGEVRDMHRSWMWVKP
jgi:hypothetical protein